MNHLFTIFVIFQLCNIFSVQGLDSLTQKFLFSTDSDRIKLMDVLVSGNNPLLFQLGYGLLSQKEYRLIKRYFHPVMQDIILYNAYSFYIMLGPKAIGSQDSRYGWYLSSHRYKNLDIRDTQSTYVNLHSPGWNAKRWRLTPVVSSISGIAFRISLAYDDIQYDKVDQSKWALSSERVVMYDMPSSGDTRVILGQGRTSNWILCPVQGGLYFKILSGGGDVISGTDQIGWMLSVGDLRTDSSGSLDMSNYVYTSYSPNTPYYWNIIFAG